MNKNNQTKSYWQKIIGIFALVSAASAIASPAIAGSERSSELHLAQVGVHSRINSPTPLNLRPRTHIPLPTSNRRNRYHRRSNYKYWKYGDQYYRDHHRTRKYRRHHRSDQEYNPYYEHRHKDTYNPRNQRNRSSITIYF